MADSRWKILSAVGLAWLVLDQLTKAAVTACIPLNHGFSVIPGFFDLVAEKVAIRDYDGVSAMLEKIREYQTKAGGNSIPSAAAFKAEKLYNRYNNSRPLAIICLATGVLAFMLFCLQIPAMAKAMRIIRIALRIFAGMLPSDTVAARKLHHLLEAYIDDELSEMNYYGDATLPNVLEDVSRNWDTPRATTQDYQWAHRANLQVQAQLLEGVHDKESADAAADYWQDLINELHESPYCEADDLEAALNEKIEKIGKGYQLQRYKGLGEMNADQLWDTTMNPATRTLIRVTMKDAAEADQMFSMLMGENPELRRKFIEENASLVTDLDV